MTRNTWLAGLMGAGAVGAAAVAGLDLATLGTRRAWDAERRFPARGRFIRLPGVDLHVVEARGGEGGGAGDASDDRATLVLVHGALATLHEFTLGPLWELAARGRRVVALDRPGLGYSTRRGDDAEGGGERGWGLTDHARVLGELLDALGLERPVVVGHSLGAAVAVSLAVDRPGRAGYVLVNPLASPSLPGAAQRWGWLLRTLAVPGVGAVAAHTGAQLAADTILPAFIETAFAPEPVPPVFEEYAASLSRRPESLRNEARDLLRLESDLHRLTPRLGEVTDPVRIVAGEHDRVCPVSRHARPLAEAVRGAELEVLPGAGHMIHVTRAERVIEAVDRMGC